MRDTFAYLLPSGAVGSHRDMASTNPRLPLSSRERRSPSSSLCFPKEIIKTRTELFQPKPSEGNHSDIPLSTAAPCFVLCACNPRHSGEYISHRELSPMMNSLGSHCSNKHCCFFFPSVFLVFLLVLDSHCAVADISIDELMVGAQVF